MLKKKTKKPEVSNADPRFADITFRGSFREYQQRVIDNSCKYFEKDNRIHIVAAPGSGKTILGLELVRIIGAPALVLSPTIAIRDQWRERFEEMYMPENRKIGEYVSCSLIKPSLLTSITYQGLYTSYRRLVDRTKPEETEGDDGEAVVENYSGVNIIELMEQNNISTIVLDEAHHLRAEWQKALTEFIAMVSHKVKIVALTATPPYDSKKSEWDKYIAVCGPIDEEIFVPELIRAKNLCPHQDFIYYNFPTEEESCIIEKYQQNVEQTIKDVFAEGKFLEIIKNAPWYNDPDEFEDELHDRPEFVKALLAFLQESNEKPPKALRKSLEKDDRDITWDTGTAQLLFQSMISDDQMFGVKDRDFVKGFLSRLGLVEKSKVSLITNEELEKLLFSSTGKLKSISAIIDQEFKNLGDKIRLLVLTDYIRVNSAVLGTDKEIKEMGVVPIFELIRRAQPELKLAAISGKIIIVPNASLDGIREVAKRDNARFKSVPIKDTEHSELRFEASNSGEKIGVITRAFNAGIINGIVGTKSLLGEGWDSPVINTLVLASFVGSFMLSNQMRGRAIRVDKNVPDKVSNIWHLTAILPEHLLPDVKGAVPSADYATLERRFHGFMGLCYQRDVIESTLQRANTLDAPYDEASVARANEKTFEIARDRDAIRTGWEVALAKSSNEVIIQNEIPKPKRGFIPALIMKPTHYSTVKKISHAVMKTFKDLDLINRKAKVVLEKNYTQKTIDVGTIRSSKYEKSIFHQAMSEVCGPIDAPKYVLIKVNKQNGKLDYRCAFAVPVIFDNNKATAETFHKRMQKRITDFELTFTRSADGKKHIGMVKRRAYVNKTNNEIQTKMKLREGKA